jgi:hypothetical protein
MDGLVIKKLKCCAATVSWQESRPCSLVSSICAARHSSHKHKKRAGFALTRLATLSQNISVREYVHGEKVLTQPMTSE